MLHNYFRLSCLIPTSALYNYFSPKYLSSFHKKVILGIQCLVLSTRCTHWMWVSHYFLLNDRVKCTYLAQSVEHEALKWQMQVYLFCLKINFYAKCLDFYVFTFTISVFTTDNVSFKDRTIFILLFLVIF